MSAGGKRDNKDCTLKTPIKLINGNGTKQLQLTLEQRGGWHQLPAQVKIRI